MKANVRRPKIPNTNTDGFSLASNNFGLDLLQRLQNQNQNVFFSPYSIAVALSTVYHGAGGQSAQQLQKAMRFDQVSKLNGGERQAVAQSVRQLIEELQSQDNQSVSLDSASLMVVDEQFQIKEDYVKSVTDNYDVRVIRSDFKTKREEIFQQINNFVANKTHGLINPMLEEAPSEDTVLSLVNAIYFKGQWAEKFDAEKTKPGVFYGANGQQYPDVQFMNARGRFPFIELAGLNADMIMIKYQGEDVVFVAILPKDREANLDNIRKQLNSTYIDDQIRQMVQHRESNVYLPKMELSTTYDLIPPLKELGVQDVFNEAADLSGISDGQSKIKVSQVSHKAKLIVNEEGTEAGAGTYIGIALMAAPVDPPTFRFDHPFLYFIRHNPTGQILFIGEAQTF